MVGFEVKGAAASGYGQPPKIGHVPIRGDRARDVWAQQFLPGTSRVAVAAGDVMADGRDEVVLVVPAAPEYLRLARMTAAGLASRLGFTYDDVEDLRIAVDELCFVLVGSGGRAGSIALTYCVDDGALTIEGVGRFTPGEAVEAPSELSEQILAAVVDEHALHLSGDEPRFRLRKRASGLG